MPSASNEEAAKVAASSLAPCGLPHFLLPQCFKDAIALEDCPPHHTELAKVLLAMSKKEVLTQCRAPVAVCVLNPLYYRRPGRNCNAPLTFRALSLQIVVPKMLPAL